MRLALKIGLSLGFMALVVLGISTLVEERRRDELMALDLDTEIRTARAVRVLATAVCEKAGVDAARYMIEKADANLPRNARWLALDAIPNLPGRNLRGEIEASMQSGEPVWLRLRDPNGHEMRYMYVPIAPWGHPEATIELSESLDPRVAFHRRGQMQTAAVGVVVLILSATLAALLGRRLIREPIEKMATGLKALGDGHFDAHRPIARRDELGRLSTEISALGARLAERERVRHADRLRTVGELASGVAHELGTPLSVIGVRARLIVSGDASGAEITDNAAAILEQTDRMTRLVRQLLDYSRRESPQMVSVDLRQTIVQAVEMLEPLARSQGVTMSAVTPEHPMLVHGNGGQLQQVVTNLMLNGIQAMTVGGELTVTAGSSVVAAPAPLGGPPVRRWWIEVADTGPGIAPEHLAHVLEPFFTTKPIGEGTGLGLAVADAIVEEHGGWIAVESEPGHGARFRIHLPPDHEAMPQLLAS